MRPMWVNGGMLLVVLAMTGVVARTGKPPDPPRRLESLTSVLERIRQDVGRYEVQAALWRGDLPGQTFDPALTVPAYVDPPDAEHPNGLVHPAHPVVARCPTKPFDFDVTKVEVTLQVVQGTTTSGSVGLKVPYAGAEGAAGANRETTATRTLVLDREPVYDLDALSDFMQSGDYLALAGEHERYLLLQAGQATSDAISPTIPVFPISETLLSLRRNLVEASEKVPCFQIPDGPSANTIRLDFQVAKSSSQDIGFSLEIVSAKASATEQQMAHDTITVTYTPHVGTSHAVAVR